jgi:hypothetical protein
MKKRWKLTAGIAGALVIALTITGVVIASPWANESQARSGGFGQGYGAPGFAATSTTAGATGAAAAPEAHPSLPPSDGELTQEQAESLVFLREEEKLARDVYTVLHELWGKNVFKNIAASESRHMDSVKTLLDAYGLADPIATDTPGVFTNAGLQQAYNDLVAQGSRSLEEALKVGVAIEELDIADLQELLAMRPSADIAEVAQNLLKASQNHLAAFTRLLAA